MKKGVYICIWIVLLLAQLGCNPAPKEGDESGTSRVDGKPGSVSGEDSADKTGSQLSYVLDPSKIDWETVHFEEPVTVLHTWQDYPADASFVATTTTNGRRVIFGDRSQNSDEYAVWIMDLPDLTARELFSLPDPPEKLMLSTFGATVFAVCKDGGYLYSIPLGKLLTKVDYDYCKEAAGISPDGTVFTCWGGDKRSVYHYNGQFDHLSAQEFWVQPIPSAREELYGIDPVLVFPSFGISQLIIQTGTFDLPSFTYLTINTNQHNYFRYNSVAGYLVCGTLSKNSLFLRALYAPSENYLSRTDEGAIPLTHKATINLRSMGINFEPLGKVLTRLPLAVCRLAEYGLFSEPDGGLSVVRFDTGETVYLAPSEDPGSLVFQGCAGDLKGVLVTSGNDLQWLDMRGFKQ